MLPSHLCSLPLHFLVAGDLPLHGHSQLRLKTIVKWGGSTNGILLTNLGEEATVPPLSMRNPEWGIALSYHDIQGQ